MSNTENLRAALERFCDATACIPMVGQPVTSTMVLTLGMALSEARAVLDAQPKESAEAATLTISVEGSTTTIDCDWGDAVRSLPPGSYPLRLAR